jgi:uncharacterized protein YkwD
MAPLLRISAAVTSLVLLFSLALVGTPLASADTTVTLVPMHQSHVQHNRRHRRRHHRHHVAKSSVSSVSTSQGPTLVPPCTDANTPATSASAQTMTNAVVCLINGERLKYGLPPLSTDSELNSVAQNWTSTMISTAQFTHGTNFAGRVSASGYDWQAAGENIAAGYPTPASAVSAWMASSDHCENILNPTFRNVGTAVSNVLVRAWGTGPSTWTQDFGLLMSARAQSSNWGPSNGCPYSS